MAVLMRDVGSSRRRNMTRDTNVEQMLAHHTARLRICLQNASGNSSGPEEGSDAWLLLNALTGSNYHDDQTFFTSFEQSGRWLAKQGGKLDARLYGLQRNIDALAAELKKLLSDQLDLLVEA